MKKVILCVIVLFVLNVVLNACTDRGALNSDESGIESISNTCPGETNGSNLSGIVNGKTIGQGNMFASRVVGLLMKSKEGLSTCTGSLLPGNVVLTASHCVVDGDMAVIFSTDWECTGEKTEMRRVTKRIVHPLAEGGKNQANDLGMVKFEGTVPAGYVPFTLPESSDVIQSQDKMIMIGFGRVARDTPIDFKLRITSASAASNLISNSNGVYFLDQRATGVCSGDSGGPLIVVRNGVPAIMAVASAVSNPLAPAKQICSGYSFFASAAAQAEWIKTSYQELTR